MSAPGIMQLGKKRRRRAKLKNGRHTSGTENGLDAMVADDDPMVCRMAAAMLKRLGYRVNTFHTGVDVLFHCSRSPADFLLADYEMPEINGYQLGRTIKTRLPRTRVVVMTGLCRSEVAGIMTDTTIDAWLFKPFYSQDLEKVLMRIGLPGNSGYSLKDTRNP
jgi:CheY-like chemotaxis protein